MVVAILGDGRSRATMLVQLNAPAVEFDLVQPLLALRLSRTQNWSCGQDVMQTHGNCVSPVDNGRRLIQINIAGLCRA
jgi:hypothetical protein